MKHYNLGDKFNVKHKNERDEFTIIGIFDPSISHIMMHNCVNILTYAVKSKNYPDIPIGVSHGELEAVTFREQKEPLR